MLIPSLLLTSALCLFSTSHQGTTGPFCHLQSPFFIMTPTCYSDHSLPNIIMYMPFKCPLCMAFLKSPPKPCAQNRFNLGLNNTPTFTPYYLELPPPFAQPLFSCLISLFAFFPHFINLASVAFCFSNSRELHLYSPVHNLIVVKHRRRLFLPHFHHWSFAIIFFQMQHDPVSINNVEVTTNSFCQLISVTFQQ